jgi:hypothetical protein
METKKADRAFGRCSIGLDPDHRRFNVVRAGAIVVSGCGGSRAAQDGPIIHNTVAQGVSA